MGRAATISIRKGREGSRWWNVRPSSEEVAEWFKTVPLHDSMDHDRYIGGIILIPQSAKTDEIEGEFTDGSPRIRRDVRNQTYTPYPKVETRVQYFHDLMAKHDDWMGVIEPVGGGENGLPPGFFTRVVQSGDRGQYQHRYVCCTIRVRVYERGTVRETLVNNQAGLHREPTVIRTGKTVIEGPPATKMVPLLNSYGKPDAFSLMKAETGAVGRALGMAGMLVVPGAGVATAEDMNEAHALEQTPVPAEQRGGEAAQLPQEKAPGVDNEAQTLKEEATVAINELKTDFPGAFDIFKEWCQSREIESLADVSDVPTLRGLMKKANKDLEAAKAAQAEREGTPAPEDKPPEEPAEEAPVQEPEE